MEESSHSSPPSPPPHSIPLWSHLALIEARFKASRFAVCTPIFADVTKDSRLAALKRESSRPSAPNPRTSLMLRTACRFSMTFCKGGGLQGEGYQRIPTTASKKRRGVNKNTAATLPWKPLYRGYCVGVPVILSTKYRIKNNCVCAV